MIILTLIIGCTGPITYETWIPNDTGVNYDEVASPTLIADELNGPIGLTRWLDEIFVAEEDGGRIQSIESGEIWVDGLGGPTWLESGPAGLLVADSAGGALILLDESGDVHTLSDGHQDIGRITMIDSQVWWLDPESGELWTMTVPDGTPTLLTNDLVTPVGLDVHNGVVWVLDQDSQELSTVVSETGELETQAILDDPPHDLIVDGSTAFVTTRSTRWPYGGFIVSIEDGTISRLSDSPPEPERIGLDETHVYWTSKQSITRVSRNGGTYELVSGITAAEDLWIETGTMFWTDGQAGEVRSW